MKPMFPRRPGFPAQALALWLSFGLAALLVLQTMWQRDLHASNHVFFAYDFSFFFNAGRAFVAGRNPYDDISLVTPPVSLALAVPLASLEFNTARWWVAAAQVALLLGGFALLLRLFVPAGPSNGAQARQIWCWGLLALALSYPFLFLLDRLNIDGFVAAFTAFSLFWAQRETERPGWPRAILAGGLLAIAVGLKVYPILMILPLLAWRRWRVLGAFGGALALMALAAPTLWVRYVSERLLQRADTFACFENASLPNTFRFVAEMVQWRFDQITAPPSPWGVVAVKIAYATCAVLLSAKIWADWRRAPTQRFIDGAVWYWPFLFVLPKTVYHYGLVALWLLLPALGARWAGATTKAQRAINGVLLVGLALSQTQAQALTSLFEAPQFQIVPGAGLLLLALGSVAASWSRARE